MDYSVLLKQNPWWTAPSSINDDQKIKEFDKSLVKWMPSLWSELDLGKDVLYTIRGPRQVGKTTLLKLIVKRELEQRKPIDVFYFQCDVIDEYKELHEIIETYLSKAERESTERKLVLIDEITRVKDWQYAYKAVVDRRGLENLTFVLTGSSSWDLKHGAERLPGRKGEKHGLQSERLFLPPNFREYAELRSEKIRSILREIKFSQNKARNQAFQELFSSKHNKTIDLLLPYAFELDELLDEYFLTGGIMAPVNEYASKKEVGINTYILYLQFFFGDVTKLKRDESIAKKIISACLNTQLTPTGWHNLAKNAGISTHVTAMDYVELLQTLFLFNAFNNYDASTRKAKQRSEKKINFSNPFFFHAFKNYFENSTGDFFQLSKTFLSSNENKSILAETITGDHLVRLAYNHTRTDLFDSQNLVFYWRTNRGEIDYVIKLPQADLPVEVKYQNSIKDSDFNELKKFKKGLLVTKDKYIPQENYPAVPLPMFLLYV